MSRAGSYANWLVEHAREFAFPVVPADHELRRRYSDLDMHTIRVRYRGPNSWAVIGVADQVLTIDGEWVFEPQPSSRTEDFIKSARFSLDAAVGHAQVEALRALERLEKKFAEHDPRD